MNEGGVPIYATYEVTMITIVVYRKRPHTDKETDGQLIA